MKVILFVILVTISPILATAQNSTKIVKASAVFSNGKNRTASTPINYSIKDNQVFVYTGDNGKGYFKKLDNGNWGEFNYSTGEKVFSFTSIEESSTYKIIYDKSRKTYIKLTADKCLWSFDVNNFDKKAHDGHWEKFPK